MTHEDRPTSADVARAARERVATLSAGQPELESSARLQLRLIERQLVILDALPVDYPLPPVDVSGQWDQGLPAFAGLVFPLPYSAPVEQLDRFCDDLAEGGAGAVAEHILEVFIRGRVDRRSLLAASLRRDGRAIRAGANQLGVAPDLFWLVGELAAAPIAYRAQAKLLGDRRGADAPLWDDGHCLACGSWPGLAEMVADLRTMRCSFCGASWRPREMACTYCGESGERFTLAAPDVERPFWRLELCRVCDGYLKTIDVPRPAPFPLASLDDLATTTLDVAAMQHGFRRPPLRELASPSVPECPPAGAS